SSCSPEFCPSPCRRTTTAFGFPRACTVQYWSLPTPWETNVGCHFEPHPASATASTQSALLVQLHEDRAARDTIARLDVDRANRRVVRRVERRLHLHRLQYDERVAGADC